jgi:hypothetical protein
MGSTSEASRPMTRSMDISSSAQLTSMAASTDNGLEVAMLKKATDIASNSMLQLLQGLPQKDGAGQLVDVQA